MHCAAFCSRRTRQKINKIKWLKFKLRPENPRVRGSISRLATSKIKGLREVGNI